MNFTNTRVNPIIRINGGYMKSIFVLVLLALHASAQIIETPNLKSCLAAAETQSSQFSPNDVLYVFDIDNTVLELKQNLGSVQWFRWQRELIEKGEPQYRVATTIESLLSKQAWIYQMAATKTPESQMADALLDLQKAGHPVMFHTSRNTDVRGPTERELKLNFLIPLLKTVGPMNGYPGEIGFPDGPANQRKSSFQNGIFMSAGQDKGRWLTLLLGKTNFQPKTLVFIDDERKNLEYVEKAFASRIPFILCRYGKLDEVVSAFNNSNKEIEIELWNTLAEVASSLQ